MKRLSLLAGITASLLLWGGAAQAGVVGTFTSGGTTTVQFQGVLGQASIGRSSDGTQQLGLLFVLNPVNIAPVNTLPASQTTNEDTPLILSQATGNLISVSDADAGTAALTVELRPRNGRISFNTTAATNPSDLSGITFLSGSSTTSAVKRISGSQNALNMALRNLTFTPIANFNGAASLQIKTDDGGNTGSGGALTDTDLLSITINPINDPPTARNDGVTAQVGGAARTVPVLNNDSSLPDGGETLLITSMTQPAAGGGNVIIASDAKSLSYTPGITAGSYAFTYTINDGTPGSNATATVRVTLNPTAGAATDVNATTSRVTVSRSGYSNNRFDPNTYLQVLTLTNGGTAITGPVYLALDNLPSGMTLDNKDGVTTQTTPTNSPYLDLQRDTLGANEVVQVTLRFTSATGTPTYTTRVLAGGAP